MSEERIELLKQYYKLKSEKDKAESEGFSHIARARAYRMKLIDKKLNRIKENELRNENG